jgi:hypothetical protein
LQLVIRAISSGGGQSLALAFFRESRLARVRHPDLQRAKTRRAKRIAPLLGSFMTWRRAVFCKRCSVSTLRALARGP